MFIDSNIYEDLYTTYLYLDKCHNFEYEDETYYSIYHDGKGSSLSYDINSKKINKSLEILIYLYNNLKEESLKKSLLYRASVLYFSYMVRKVKHKDGYTSNEFNKLIKELGIILKNNKIEFYIDNKLKKVIYRIFLKVYARK